MNSVNRIYVVLSKYENHSEKVYEYSDVMGNKYKAVFKDKRNAEELCDTLNFHRTSISSIKANTILSLVVGEDDNMIKCYGIDSNKTFDKEYKSKFVANYENLNQ